MTTMRTTQLPPPVTVQRDLDKTHGTCYRIDDETFEAEEFGKTFSFHDATLENGNNGLFSLNHCTKQGCVVYQSNGIRSVAVEPKITLSPFFKRKSHVETQSIAVVVFAAAVDGAFAWLWKIHAESGQTGTMREQHETNRLGTAQLSRSLPVFSPGGHRR
jgi:hypothetical protein